MRTVNILIYLLLLTAGITSAQSLLLQEDFSFTSGTDLAGQNGWTKGVAGTNLVTISDTGLSLPGYPNSGTGKAALFIPTSDRDQKAFTGTLSGAYYYSFMISVASAGTGDYFIGLYSSSAFRGRVYLKSDGVGFQFGIVKTTTGTITYTTGVPYNYNTVYSGVVKYEFSSAATTDDKVSLYINPDFGNSELGAATIGPITDLGNDVNANVIAIQGRANCGTFILDGIRIADSWSALRGGPPAVTTFLELPKFIGSNMVLQRDKVMKFWGWGSAGEIVKAVFSRQGNQFSNTSVIDASGRWSLELPEQPVCADSCQLSFELLNKTGTTQVLNNILVGDVWFAGGQSNMEKRVSWLLDSVQVIAEADNYPLIRSFKANYNQMNTPQERVVSTSIPWFVCNSAQVGSNVSAVAYIFARKIYENQKIPIGIIQSYRGGTEIETWMSHAKISTDPELAKVNGRIAGADTTNATGYPSCHFNGQINPLKGIPIKGFIFYQGESNTKRALEYRFMMKKLVEDWRSLWNMGDLPFYYVQLFNMGVSVSRLYEEGNWQDIREQQEFLAKEKIPNTAMAVIIDTNEDPDNPNTSLNIHPHNKRPVGERLALLALKYTYGKDVFAESPSLSGYYFRNDTAYVVFKNYGQGLKMKSGDAKLKGFVIASSSKSFKEATAVIVNDSTIALSSSLVSVPFAVRYAWSKNPDCNLYNSVDLPASPFRTDIWPSGFAYLSFPSTSPLETNSSLLTIEVSGKELGGFNQSTLSYTYKLASSETSIPQVRAVTKNPFAVVTIAQAANLQGNITERTATITVTAEDGTKMIYEVLFSFVSAIKDDSKEGSGNKINHPSKFGLMQNFPNPFNPSTAITYQVAAYGKVSIKAYDLLGSEVATLVNEDKATGSYTASFNGENLVNGVYFIMMNAAGFSGIKKIVLMK